MSDPSAEKEPKLYQSTQKESNENTASSSNQTNKHESNCEHLTVSNETKSSDKETDVQHCGIVRKSGIQRGSKGTRAAGPDREKPFKCTRCNNQYTNKQSLKRHMVIHEGTFLLCQICNQSFTQKGGLTRHLSVQHDSLQCYTCSKVFPRGEFLSHVRECPRAASDPRNMKQALDLKSI